MDKKNSNNENLISNLTIKEFIELSKEINKSNEKVFVYGYKELADFLNCSDSKVRKLVKSGKIDEAIYKSEGLIFFDKQKILEALKIVKNK